MVKNIHMYQKKKIGKNINIRHEKMKLIISKAILRRLKLEIIEEFEEEEADVNLKKSSNPY